MYTCFVNHELRFVLRIYNPGFQLKVPGTSCKINGTFAIVRSETPGNNLVQYSPTSCTTSCKRLPNNRCSFITESEFRIAETCEEFEAIDGQGNMYDCVWVQPLNQVDTSGAHDYTYQGEQQFEHHSSASALLMPLATIATLAVLALW